MSTKRIYRYPLNMTDETAAVMPIGAEVLSVSTDRGRFEAWAIVDTAQPITEARRFRVIGTGNPMPDEPGRFLGTVMVARGALVFHVFEVR